MALCNGRPWAPRTQLSAVAVFQGGVHNLLTVDFTFLRDVPLFLAAGRVWVTLVKRPQGKEGPCSLFGGFRES